MITSGRGLERPLPLYSGLDQHVHRTTGHDQMLHGVAADEDELAVRIDRCRLHDAEPAVAPAQQARPAPSCKHEGLERPGDGAMRANANRKAAVMLSVAVIDGIAGPERQRPESCRQGSFASP